MNRIAKSLPAAVALALVPLAAAAQDKVVNVYNWSDYVGEGVLDDFTKETGIKVVYDVYDSNGDAGDQAARRRLRLRHHRADRPQPRAA